MLSFTSDKHSTGTKGPVVCYTAIPDNCLSCWYQTTVIRMGNWVACFGWPDPGDFLEYEVHGASGNHQKLKSGTVLSLVQE